MSDLKPCPFCGELPIVDHESDCGVFTYWVVCPKCGIRTQKNRDKTVGVEVWNRRAQETNSDLISRQALCEYALNQKDKSVTPNDIMRFSSAQPEQRWIPIEERKPDNKYDDWVLAQIREKDSGYLWIPKVVEYREQKDDWFEERIGWLKDNPDDAFEVIAWMPLPEPYFPNFCPYCGSFNMEVERNDIPVES